MSNIVQSILASLVVAVILGILAYSLIIRENQIYIEVLTDKVEKTQQNLAENTKSINNLKVLIAQAFPKKQIFSISSSGNVKPIDISPLSTAVIISGANFTSELAKYANKKSDKPPKELIKSKEEYELLYALAKQENPNMYLAETVGVRKTHPQPTIKCKHKTYNLISPRFFVLFYFLNFCGLFHYKRLPGFCPKFFFSNYIDITNKIMRF